MTQYPQKGQPDPKFIEAIGVDGSARGASGKSEARLVRFPPGAAGQLYGLTFDFPHVVDSGKQTGLVSGGAPAAVNAFGQVCAPTV